MRPDSTVIELTPDLPDRSVAVLPILAHSHWVQRLRVRWIILATLLIGVIASPWIYYPHDFWNYWLDWEYQTLGLYPWRPYTRASIVCDYPPLQLYLLTIADAVRLALGVTNATGFVNLLLIKGPWILAWSGGCGMAAWAARSIDPRAARPAALAWALALPLFVNAALWGQADALLSMLIAFSVALLWRDRLKSASAIFGLALSLKLQAIFALPALVVYAWRRWSFKAVWVSAVVALGTALLAALPMIVAGHGRGVIRAYANAVDLYPVRTVDAFNIWFAYDYPPRPFDGARVSKITDSAPLFHHLSRLTCKEAALLMLAGWVGAVCIALWRNPTRARLAAAAALCVLGTFTLSTQMHDRYGLPAIGLLAMIAWTGRREAGIFACASIFIGVNQLAALVNNWLWCWGLERRWMIDTYNAIGLTVSIVNVLLLIYAGAWFLRGGWAENRLVALRSLRSTAARSESILPWLSALVRRVRSAVE